MMNLLILGGTTEASELGRALSSDRRFAATMSLAGRTRRPQIPAIPTRIGGFGGVEGLVRHLTQNRIALLIDATHPFATQMSANARAAARLSGTPLLTVLRPAWQPVDGDHWILVDSMPAASEALGVTPRTVLLTIGQKDLAPFAAAPQHRYVLRSVDPPPPEALPPLVTVISARGPFRLDDELRLLRDHGIELVVTKNSGGSATQAKLAAARALGLPVIMLRRPLVPTDETIGCETVGTAAEALAWLARHHAASPRGE
jgi:precorrin-6A/cobalt-precorrin-6A reductase